MFSKRGITAVFVILAADICGLFLFVLRGEHFWMGWPIFLASFIAIGLLVVIAKRLPSDLLQAKTEAPRAGALKIGIIGALFYTTVILTEFIGMGAGVPAFVDVFMVLAVEAAFLFTVLRLIGRWENARQLVLLSVGLVLPIAAIGLISESRFPLIVVVDVAFGVFIWKLFQKYGGRESKSIEEYVDATGS